MQTLKVDSRKRVLLTGARPGQVYSRTDNPDGSVLLVPVKEVERNAGPKYPRGSLVKYFTGKLGRERNELELALLKGCVKEPE